MIRCLLLATALLPALAAPVAAQQGGRIGDLTVKAGEIPHRLVGYGLVTGLEGTGDRAFGGFLGDTPTIRSIVNMLRRFGIDVPPQALQARNVAAVMVTAELSPWLRPGGRFEVQVSSLGDALSLRGGVLFMTPLIADPNMPPVATAQGPVTVVIDEQTGRSAYRLGNAGRVPDGGILEVALPAPPAPTPRLQLRRPDLRLATSMARAINAAYGDGVAKVEDPGTLALNPPQGQADNLLGFLAAVDTLPVALAGEARIVISARDGTVVAGGDVRVGAAAVSHRGITVRIGGPAAAPDTMAGQGMLALASGATVQEVAAGLHAAGASSREVAAIFDALAEVGALPARVTVR